MFNTHVIMPRKNKLYSECKLLEAVAAVEKGTTCKTGTT